MGHATGPWPRPPPSRRLGFLCTNAVEVPSSDFPRLGFHRLDFHSTSRPRGASSPCHLPPSSAGSWSRRVGRVRACNTLTVLAPRYAMFGRAVAFADSPSSPVSDPASRVPSSPSHLHSHTHGITARGRGERDRRRGDNSLAGDNPADPHHTNPGTRKRRAAERPGNDLRDRADPSIQAPPEPSLPSSLPVGLLALLCLGAKARCILTFPPSRQAAGHRPDVSRQTRHPTGFPSSRANRGSRDTPGIHIHIRAEGLDPTRVSSTWPRKPATATGVRLWDHGWAWQQTGRFLASGERRDVGRGEKGKRREERREEKRKRREEEKRRRRKSIQLPGRQQRPTTDDRAQARAAAALFPRRLYVGIWTRPGDGRPGFPSGGDGVDFPAPVRPLFGPRVVSGARLPWLDTGCRSPESGRTLAATCQQQRKTTPDIGEASRDPLPPS
ncbi:hypothetical protein JHW43_009109 [Diplocarpon mali]|nr:hypothetical protein JHW43_009109 [Diplocarpon mali]